MPHAILHASNLIWLIASASAFALILPRVPTRRGRAAIILGCAVALLFPIISIADDFAEERGSLEQLLATLVVAFVAVMLAELALVVTSPTPLPAFMPDAKSDPRSPPRR